MLTGKDILWGIVVPAVIAAVATLLARFARRKTNEIEPWGAAVGIVLGFTSAFISVRHMPPIPPTSADGWLLLAGVPIIIFSVIASFGWTARITAIAGSVATLALLTGLLLYPRQAAIGNDEVQKLMAYTAVAMVGWWLAMEVLSHRVRGFTLPLLLVIWAMGCAAVLMNSGSQAFGQLAGGVAFSIVGIAAIALFVRGMTLARGGILAIAAIMLGLLIYGHVYSEVTMRDAVLLTIAPLAIWVGEIPGMGLRPVARFASRVVLMLIIMALPLATAVKGLHKTLKDQTDSYQY